MDDELFTEEETASLSPYEKFKERHKIRCHKSLIRSHQYVAKAGANSLARYGKTEKETVQDLAQSLDLDGWRELNWDE